MVSVISTDDLKQALDDEKVDALYDNRGQESYETLHIKSARLLSIPDAAAGQGLPEQKESFLVFY